jgi:hypothetical protein
VTAAGVGLAGSIQKFHSYSDVVAIGSVEEGDEDAAVEEDGGPGHGRG